MKMQIRFQSFVVEVGEEVDALLNENHLFNGEILDEFRSHLSRSNSLQDLRIFGLCPGFSEINLAQNGRSEEI
jgi:hypothetical protein